MIMDQLREKHKTIYSVFKWAIENFSKVPDAISELFQCLSSNSPVCSYINATNEVLQLTDKLFDPNLRSQADVMKEIQVNIPIIFNVLTSLIIECCLPNCFKGLILDLVDLAFEPFNNAELVRTPSATHSSETCRFVC